MMGSAASSPSSFRRAAHPLETQLPQRDGPLMTRRSQQECQFPVTRTVDTQDPFVYRLGVRLYGDRLTGVTGRFQSRRADHNDGHIAADGAEARGDGCPERIDDPQPERDVGVSPGARRAQPPGPLNRRRLRRNGRIGLRASDNRACDDQARQENAAHGGLSFGHDPNGYGRANTFSVPAAACTTYCLPLRP